MDTEQQRYAASARLPWVSLALCAFAGLLQLWPALAAVLTASRTDTVFGAWRLWSAHFAHWSTAHATWDIATFAALSIACERQSRGRMVGTVLLASPLITLSVFVVHPELSHYRGLSGLDCALFALWVSDFAARNWVAASRPLRALYIFLPLTLIGKLAFEMASGSALFVAGAGEDFVPVPIAHAVGGGIGLGVGITALPWRSTWKRRARSMVQARTIAAKSSALSEAPPMSPPSMSR